MNKQALETSSKEVCKAAEYVKDNLSKGTQNHWEAPLVYYFLNKLGSTESQTFIKNWPDTEANYIDTLYESPQTASLYADMVSDFTDPKENETVRQYTSRYKSLQTKRGGFPISDFSHSGPLWFLSQVEPRSKSVKDGVHYFLNEVLEHQERHRIGHLAMGALALSEIDYYEYNDELETIGNELVELADEKCTENGLDFSFGEEIWLILFALNRTPIDAQETIENISYRLKSSQKDDGSFEKSAPMSGDTSIFYTAECGLGLIAAGQGPKKSVFNSQWGRKKRRQKIERSRPEFVRTVPIDPSAEYAAEIQEASEKIIRNAKNTLRVNSLYIDMLFDDIIDLVETNPELEVKVLTRGRDVRGNRQRIKKDVLDDLIEVTEGNVKQYHRVHSRLLISDSERMVVSSADLTRDQLRDQFNAGIYTKDEKSISKAVNYFERIWDKAERIS